MSEENNIIEIDSMRPHIVVDSLGGNKHVIPLQFLKNVAAGSAPITDLEEYEKIIPTIIYEWLRFYDDDDGWKYFDRFNPPNDVWLLCHNGERPVIRKTDGEDWFDEHGKSTMQVTGITEYIEKWKLA